MKLGDVPGLEEDFKKWCVNGNKEKTTAHSYWDRLKRYPYFSLYEDNEDDIIGRLDKRIQSRADLTAMRQFVEFLFDEYEADLVEEDEYLSFKKKRNVVKNNLEVPSNRKQSDKYDDIASIKRNYIHKEDLHYLLKNSELKRRRLWYVLYSTGARIGEIKRLTPDDLIPDYGRYGAVEIPRKLLGRKKSPKDRTIEFLTPYPMMVLSRAPIGEWEDEAGDVKKGVFYPELYSQLENYYMEKHGEDIGIEDRSPHSFRHTRITDLIKGSIPEEISGEERDFSAKDVQVRAGHVSRDTTDRYTETSFSQPPETYERYAEREGIDIEELLGLSK